MPAHRKRTLGHSALSALLAPVSIVIVNCGDQANTVARGEPTQILIGEAAVVIGEVDSLPGHALYQVRGAVRNSAGDIYVADGSSGELRVFNAEGTSTRVLGGRGAGPGEHRALAGLWLANGDTVISYDVIAPKLVYWSPAGEVAREVVIQGERQSVVARLGHGEYVTLSTGMHSNFPKGTSYTDTAVVNVFFPDTRQSVKAAAVPYQTRFAATLPTGGTIYTPLPLEPRAVFAASNSIFYVGYGSDWTIQRYGRAGEPMSPVTLPQARRPLTAEALQAWKDSIVARMPANDRPVMERYLASLPYSDSLPAFDTLVADDLDNLWVRHFPVTGEDSATWTIVNAEGRVLTVTRLPSQLRLLHVGRDFVVVADTREDGTETVSVRQVTR